MPGLGPGHKRRDAHCPFQLKSEEVLLQRLRRDPPSRRTLKPPPEVMLHTTQPGVSPQGERCLSGSPGRPLACNQNRKEPPSDHCATSTQNHQPKWFTAPAVRKVLYPFQRSTGSPACSVQDPTWV